MASHPNPVSKPYEFQPFPSVRYRKDADGAVETCLVHNEEAAAALDAGWADSPAALDKAPAPAAPKAPKGNGGKGKTGPTDDTE